MPTYESSACCVSERAIGMYRAFRTRFLLRFQSFSRKTQLRLHIFKLNEHKSVSNVCVHNNIIIMKLELFVYQSERFECTEHLGQPCC